MSNIVCKYALICSMMFITTSALAGNERIMSFNKAKNDLKNLVYYDHHQTFYCHVPFDVHNRTILPSDFYIAKHKKRAGRMELEHIVPAENFGRAFREWREGDPACVNRKGQPFKGRRCANKTNNQFRMMQADMYNLYPSVGAVNAIRSNYNFAELPEDVDFIIDACNFKVLGHKVEPADMCKGEIARTYLYFDSEYPTYSMSKQSRRMMDAWNVLYPVTPWECTRAKRIEEIQGNTNPFVKEPCIEQGLYR